MWLFILFYFTSRTNLLLKNNSTTKGQPHQGIQGESIDPIYNNNMMVVVVVVPIVLAILYIYSQKKSTCGQCCRRWATPRVISQKGVKARLANMTWWRSQPSLGGDRRANESWVGWVRVSFHVGRLPIKF